MTKEMHYGNLSAKSRRSDAQIRCTEKTKILHVMVVYLLYEGWYDSQAKMRSFLNGHQDCRNRFSFTLRAAFDYNEIPYWCYLPLVLPQERG